MQFTYTRRFHRAFDKLSKDKQETIIHAIQQLKRNHPGPYPKGLRYHRLRGVTGASKEGKRVPVYEMHATKSVILTLQYESDEVIFRTCGEHASVLRNP